MEEPLLYKFGPELNATIKISDTYPEDDVHKIRYAKTQVLTCAQARLVRQTYSGGKHFFSELVGLTVHQTTTVYVSVHTPSLIFSAVHEGHINLSSPAYPGVVIVEKGHSVVEYIPSGTYPVVFEPGTYRVQYFMMGSKFLNDHIEHFPEIEEAIQILLKGGAQRKMFKVFRMSIKKEELLRKIRDCAEDKEFELHYILGGLMQQVLIGYNTRLWADQKVNLLANQVKANNIHRYIVNEVEQGRNVSISKLSSSYDIGYDTLLRTFKKTYGCTLHQFLLQAIMEKAHRLLVDNVSVKMTAKSLGYTGLAMFSRAFKRYYGYPPTSAKHHPDPRLRINAARK